MSWPTLAELHGTRAGYQRHKALGGYPCQACRDAHNAYMRDYQRKRREDGNTYNADYQRARYDAEKRHRRHIEGKQP